MHQKIQLPKKCVSRRLTIKKLNVVDGNRLIDFLNRDSQNYLVEAGFSFKEDGYQYQNRRQWVNIFNSTATQNYFVFLNTADAPIIGHFEIYKDPVSNTPRIGYFITPEYRSKGYGSEAYGSVLDSLSKLNQFPMRLWSQIEPDNKASRSILLKNKFRVCGARNAPAAFEEDKKFTTFSRVLSPS